MDVYVVLRRRDDGYHEYQPDLLGVFFDEYLANQQRRKFEADGECYDVEAVPLAPQGLIIPEPYDKD